MKKLNWSILREAVAGSSRDFTTGSLNTAIFLLAVPMILEMMMESVFALVDIFFVAKLGADSVAAVGVTESMMALVYAMAIGLSISATATVARRTGEGDAEGAARSAAHSLYLGAGLSVIISTIGIIFAPHLLAALGATPEAVRVGVGFTRIMLGCNFVVVFLFLLNAIFRGAGDAAIAMRVLFWANLLNVFLAPNFVFGPQIFSVLGIHAPVWLVAHWPFPHLGVMGAAVGTTIGRGVGVLIAASYLIKKSGRITIHRENWRLESKLLINLIKTAAPAILQNTIATASWSMLVRVVAGFGSEAIAGYVIGMRLIIFALLPAIGLSNAGATLVGQNLGAGQPDRAEASVWRAATINAVFLGLVGLVLMLFSKTIIGGFTTEPKMLFYGSQALHIVSIGFVFYAFGMALGAAFNGAGDTWTPTYMNFVVFWLIEIPLAHVLAYRFQLGPAGVFWAITTAFSVLAVMSAVIFRQGKWKQKEI